MYHRSIFMNMLLGILKFNLKIKFYHMILYILHISCKSESMLDFALSLVKKEMKKEERVLPEFTKRHVPFPNITFFTPVSVTHSYIATQKHADCLRETQIQYRI